MNVLEKIKNQINNHSIILYMKGTPQQPLCGFSKKAVDILISCDAEFAHIDVLANPDIRAALPQYANWPTFPQLYIQGELIGGCDIMSALSQTGELQEKIKAACSELQK
ncbi:MAG: monothiol glutaredoxin, Grx4 family [Gammaproteobacteria bacterium RIFCSPLOWO2_02_FULL_38_11]|nr:MAG: monothiol glutaredoxin, Grx4 family [Gammaproteobacteria bacterium RIFCSPHIGHO2_02_FULL_38_33]OGT23878.1 MAG: monothiol glutaredoxin, Grx4 family [Gammaproteobacteria bacterium RIFCSPHIGHO2_12_38_15]OGT69164.1 MAG: monothiol glutaredoxin, Grx4 family [Gammaproteobacteria bacterium RIFCSPLOWO2_02_FULL_38_11]OGT77723.1 MAG: monothiol glutaredoxin, Grx4 family [Gammaproteobacteria bacterium RIFCSPLOWO2_12_FULL_38_14]